MQTNNVFSILFVNKVESDIVVPEIINNTTITAYNTSVERDTMARV